MPPIELQRVKGVAAGENHTCALRSEDAFPVCWGDGGQHGAAPIDNGYLELVAGSHYTCGLQLSGRAACWGNIADPPGAPAVFDSLVGGTFHACGLAADGSVQCWGDNTYGQRDLVGGPFTALAAGETVTCGLRADGSIACTENLLLEVP